MSLPFNLEILLLVSSTRSTHWSPASLNTRHGVRLRVLGAAAGGSAEQPRPVLQPGSRPPVWCLQWSPFRKKETERFQDRLKVFG